GRERARAGAAYRRDGADREAGTQSALGPGPRPGLGDHGRTLARRRSPAGRLWQEPHAGARARTGSAQEARVGARTRVGLCPSGQAALGHRAGRGGRAPVGLWHARAAAAAARVGVPTFLQRRSASKVLSFSKQRAEHRAVSWLVMVLGIFCWVPRTLH